MSAMAYTKIPENTFETLAINAGVLLSSYTPGTPPDDEDIIGPTTGGISFQATPSFKDFGEDIDNCPKNTKELKRLEDWDIKMSGTFIAATPAIAQMLIGLADIGSTDTSKVTPRDTIDIENDFHDIWLVCDYGDVNTGNTPGHIAIHMMNTMSSGGFQIQTTDKEKVKFSFEFTAHYSIDAQDTVPFEIYIKKGTA